MKMNNSSDKYSLATRKQRISNLVLDYIFSILLGIVIGYILKAAGRIDIIQDADPIVVGVIPLLLYYVPQEILTGRTLGKLITGTKVVSQDGSKAGFWKIIFRTACRFIPLEQLSFLGGSGEPEGLHDLIPGTKVVTLK